MGVFHSLRGDQWTFKISILVTLSHLFRANHSIETSVIMGLNDIRLHTDSGKTSVQGSLDPNAAFDTVHRNILLHRLEGWVGFPGMIIKRLR